MPPEDALRIVMASRSDPGRATPDNQDCLESLRTQFGEMVVVADGIGGGKKGAQASKLVVTAILEFFRNWNGHQPRQMLVNAVGMANTLLREEIAANQEMEGTGSTIAIIHYHQGMVRIAHVGNSRVYRQRGNTIDLMTNDHTEAQRLADNGSIRQEDVAKHPRSHVLYRAIGSEPVIEVDVSDAHLIEPGDTFTLCTDGLADLVGDEEIGRAILTQKPEQACDSLVTMANERGGHDNISLAVVKFTQPPRASTPFTAGLAGPPTIQRITPSRTLPTLNWQRLNLWWKVRLAALGLLVLWFLILLIAWWLFDPTEALAGRAAIGWLLCFPAARPAPRPMLDHRARQRRNRS